MVALTIPPIIGAAIRRITSDPVPPKNITGNKLPMMAETVIMIGRKRNRAPLLYAVCTGEDKSCRAGEAIPSNSHSQGFSLGLARMYDPQLGLIWVYFGDTPGYSSGFIHPMTRRLLK